MSFTTDLALLATDVQLMHDVIHNGDTETVTTEGGNVKTVANAIRSLMGYTFRGAWVTGTDYAIKDVVTNAGMTYISSVAHTAGAVFATDQSAGKWFISQIKPWIDIADYGSNLLTAVTAIGSLRATLFIGADSVCTLDTTVPATLQLLVMNEAQISITTGKVLNILGPPIFPLAQVFTGAGTVTGLKDAKAEWWGAKADGTTDSGAAINKALQAVKGSTTEAGGIVWLLSGKYIAETPVLITYKTWLKGPVTNHFSELWGPVGATLQSKNTTLMKDSALVQFLNDGTYRSVSEDGEGQTFQDSGIENVFIYGGFLSGATLNQVGIKAKNTWNFSIKNCAGGGFGGFIADLRDVNEMAYTGNGFNGSTFLESSADCIISNNQQGGGNGEIIPIMWVSGPFGHKNQFVGNLFFNSQNCDAYNTAHAFTVDETTDVFTISAHGLVEEHPVTVKSDTALPTGLNAGTTYYVHVINANTFKLSASRTLFYAGTYVDATSTGSGTHTLTLGGKANLYLNSGATRNIFTGLRLDQSYYDGLRLDTATDNIFTGLEVAENGYGNTPASGTGITLDQTSVRNQFKGGVVTGGTGQGRGLAGDSTSIDNDFDLVFNNHSVKDIAVATDNNFGNYMALNGTAGGGQHRIASDHNGPYINFKKDDQIKAQIQANVESSTPSLTLLPGSGGMYLAQYGAAFGPLWANFNPTATGELELTWSGTTTSANTLSIGDGTWNGGHLQLGTLHIWSDGSVVRVKVGVPTSAGDGSPL